MMRRPAVLALAGLLLATAASAAGAQPNPGSPDRVALEAGLQVQDKTTGAKAPQGPNPYLALLPDPATADYAGWRAYLERQAPAKDVARERLQAAPGDDLPEPPANPLSIAEREELGERGDNDTPDDAERIRGFGTRNRQNNGARIVGNLSPETLDEDAIEPIAPNTEDDGSIPSAGDTGVTAERIGASTSGVIGDGPNGSSGSGSGDFDTYAVTVEAGQSINAATDTPDGPLDTILLVWDADGNLVDADDDGGPGLDSNVTHVAPEDGTYYVMVTGFLALPEDPFDSSSGDGAASEGPYNLTVTARSVDTDIYAVRLRPGDVLGARVEGEASTLTIWEPGEDKVMESSQDASGIYSAESPLPGGGNAVTEHVADEFGWHFVGVSGGDGRYVATVEAYRPRLEKNPPVQTLLLDFDGERVNTSIWGGPGTRDLSPLADFLDGWGIDEDDEDDLIEVIVETVEENIQQDLEDSGLNRRFRVRVRNTADNRDTFGRENVSRVIVGGSIAESGIGTIGIAQSIDPGNFGTEESAVVLLDVLSDEATEFGDPSLNNYLTDESDVIQFVGQAIGNVTSHEAGHFFGNWHVDQFNDQANLMDQGGNFPVLYGVGEDGVGGTTDDPDVDFGEDTFNPGEGFAGTEDTLSRLAEVLTR